MNFSIFIFKNLIVLLTELVRLKKQKNALCSFTFFPHLEAMDGGAWWAAVHGVARSRTRLSDFTFTFHFHALKKEMATHSSVLAWRIPETAEPGGLRSLGSHRVGHDWSDAAAAAAEAGKQTSPALPKLLQIARRPLLAFLPHYFPKASMITRAFKTFYNHSSADKSVA